MNINLSLLGQMITFAIFVYVTMKYVWPPIMKALEERQNTIAKGLEDAERSRHELEVAQKNITQQLRDAKVEAQTIIDEASRRGAGLVDEAKQQAREEGKRLLEAAKTEIQQEYLAAKQALLREVSQIALSGVEKVLQQNVDVDASNRMIDQLIREI